MSSRLFLSRRLIDRAQERLITRFKGAHGLRDGTLLESALGRPINKAQYGDSNVFELAASYLFGLIRNMAYVDGNKRIAAVAAFVFLAENGYRLETSDAALYVFVLAVTNGEIDEDGATRFLQDFSIPIGP
ncbi:type II toxin-antitoxin system death-on-curing family toxin [Rhizobium sp. BK376]|uniref:type II toxin-antitoxin system death-on-curing family toxin n=1 Tax=Rhizobium sp. BK376 TaxID=2512149 RepID=UPI0010487D9A|nr:type II toxin-antitoxin system death-on-curing family toxin [Rhizobium sp. BK376]TCR92958.1 death-on-curing protein [Rhizobium sp. BK376]